MRNAHLFGDAKASARGSDYSRRAKAYKEARERFEESPTPDTQRVLATSLFDMGRFDEAARLLRDLAANNGDDIQLLCDLAFAYKNLNLVSEAKQFFRRVVELNPRHALARCAESELWMLDPDYRPSWMRR